MKKYDLLYDWPIQQIEQLIESEEAQNFHDSLKSDDQNEFIRLTDFVPDILEKLRLAKAEKRLLLEWQGIRDWFSEFHSRFATYPALDWNRVRLTFILEQKLVNSWRAPLPADPADVNENQLNEEEIDENLFELKDLGETLPVSWFVHENARDFASSTVVFSIDQIRNLEEDGVIAQSILSPKLLMYLLTTLHSSLNVPTSSTALVRRIPDVRLEAIQTFVKLLVLTSGKAVHYVQSYSEKPHVIDPDCITPGTPYHQLSDVLYVLSEYNSRDELLSKYLTLYHVIENFMFKYPIVTLERQRGGEMFSIRDFRRLYDEAEENEFNAIKKLFSRLFDLEPIAGKKFHQFVIDRWNNLVARGSATEHVKEALQKLGVPQNGMPLTRHSNETHSYFAQIVYRVRNAVVHNKETELHLTFATLDKEMQDLIALFLIPCLEEVSFSLIGTQNDLVWYQNSSIVLYK